MRRGLSRSALGAILLLSGAGGAVASDVWAAAFTETFRAACVPQRLSYEGTIAEAVGLGWARFDPVGHPEFGAVMAKSAEALKDAGEDLPGMSYRHETFAREVEGRALHLVVSFMESEYLDAVGCYLYDFAATEPVAAATVTNILGIKPAQAHRDETMVAYVWGPPPSMPRTLDTYLIFVPAGSPYAEQAGFDGQVLKFSTSAAGEEE